MEQASIERIAQAFASKSGGDDPDAFWIFLSDSCGGEILALVIQKHYGDAPGEDVLSTRLPDGRHLIALRKTRMTSTQLSWTLGKSGVDVSARELEEARYFQLVGFPDPARSARWN
jgi:hypothetical protein